jgi:hypothetical protein
LKKHLRTFPIVEYKIPFKEFSKTENNQNFKVYKQLRSKTRQTDISNFFK